MNGTLVLTCEHASPRIPGELAVLFGEVTHRIQTHRGWDQGALSTAQSLARKMGCPLFFTRFSRLVCDTNRSPGNPEVFSEWTGQLPEAERRRLILCYHAPHWRRVRRAAQTRIARGQRVVHLAIHSFVPVLFGQVRAVDLGLLYDPRRSQEPGLAQFIQRGLTERMPELRVCHNQPYVGQGDCLPTALRRLWNSRQYLGMEMEFNQQLLDQPNRYRQLVRHLAEVLRSAR